MSVGKNDFAHPQIVAANIKFYRKRRKMKQKELADLIGYTESSISKYEQGLIQIPNTVIDLLAKALDVCELNSYKYQYRHELKNGQEHKGKEPWCRHCETVGFHT